MNTSFHLDEGEAERSPHERVDDGIDTRVDVGHGLQCVDQHQPVGAIAVRKYQVIHLERQPGDGERRRNGHAHYGHSASCLLFGG